MESGYVELSRCRDGDTVAEIRELLDAAQIHYQLGSTAPNFDITTIGTGSDPEVIVSVRRADYSAARAALEEDLSKVELPKDHYLLTSSDEEIAEILGNPSEWSPFDVAHARILAEERGIDPSDIEHQSAKGLERLKKGKPASELLLILGWLFSVMGGVIGVGIALSICYMKEKTPEGEFFTYDEKSRKIGKPMLILASAVAGLAFFLKISEILS